MHLIGTLICNLINRQLGITRKGVSKPFYSTHHMVGMMELTNTKQWKDEPVVDYINRWRSLSLDCKDRLSEIYAIEMCIQGIHWGLLYIL